MKKTRVNLKDCNENNNKDHTSDIPLIVKVSNPETGDTNYYDDYVVHNVPESIAIDLDDGKSDGILKLLFAEYPEDFPEEEHGVDVEITGFEINFSDFD